MNNTPHLHSDQPVTLSHRDRDFLRHLKFREAIHVQKHPCWLYAKTRGRWQLVVLTLMDTYEKHDRFVKNDSTIQRLMADRLIEISSETMLPEPYRNQHGFTINLTDRGRLACR